MIGYLQFQENVSVLLFQTVHVFPVYGADPLSLAKCVLNMGQLIYGQVVAFSLDIFKNQTTFRNRS